MSAFLNLARTLEKFVPLSMVAAAGSGMMRLRGDRRRFEVDCDGHWVNRQPEASFVSPDVHAAYYDQVATRIKSHWLYDYVPQGGDVVVDVGAGIGEDAVILSKLVGPSGKVHAIEAHPDVFRCLVSTVARSTLDNVECHHLAITERDGEVRISDDDQHLANTIVDAESGIKVKALSLDHFFEQAQLDRIDLLKMNIEGAERDAMNGLRDHADRIQRLAISCHDFVADTGYGDKFRTKVEVRKRMVDLGFSIVKRSDAKTSWETDVLYGKRC